jgi:hypothetical protein
MKLIKGTDQTVKFKIYDNITDRNPVDLSRFNEFICAVTEDYGRLIIEKKFSTNDIKIYTDNEAIANPYIIEVQFKKEDTQYTSLNPSDEERLRSLELFGIDVNEQVVRFLKTDFYLEGSGYYVYRNRR